jgi:hypothetical protein
MLSSLVLHSPALFAAKAAALTASATCFLDSEVLSSRAAALDVHLSIASKLVLIARNLTSSVAIEG